MLHLLSPFLACFSYFVAQGSKSKTGKASTASSSARKRKFPSTCEGVKGRKSSRQLRKGSTQQLVDEAEDEARESPNISNSDVDFEPREDASSQKKKAPRKPKKPVSETDKSAHKYKGGNVEPDQRTEEPRKKFSHSTCRNKRQGISIIFVSKIVRYDISYACIYN